MAATLCVLASVPLEAALPPHPRLLFNSAGIESLKKRVLQPEWSPQWKAFQSGYDATIDEKIELPPRGSNWFHWYVCPRHRVRLTKAKRIDPCQCDHISPPH